MKIKLFIILLISFFICLGGCKGIKPIEEKSAAELVAEGQEKYDDRDYNGAISYFQRVRDWYPFSEHVTAVELKIADSWYQLRQYEQAAAQYQEFANLHPRNPSTPYALYQVGRCYYDQIATIDRDQTATEKALEYFSRFVNRYPDNEYTAPARAHVKECQKSLASNELLAAKFYFDRKNYKAALKRFRIILDDYPDVGTQHIVLQYLAACEAHVNETVQKTASDIPAVETE